MELQELQTDVKEVFVEEIIKQYIVDLANSTRNHRDIYLGVSPRASISLMKASQAFAFISGRDFVIPDDVQYLAPYVFSHRIILHSEAKYKGASPEDMIETIVKRAHVPIKRAVKW